MSTQVAPIYASLIVDDFPLNATYWQRLQMGAIGYERPAVPGCAYSRNWPALRTAPFMPAALTREFAEFVQEFGVRGKFTLLPCPAGLGRIDREVRTLDTDELRAMLQVVREELAPRFDITPEVLTHTLAMDIETGALLPHGESPWLSYLAATGRHNELCAYLRHAYTILGNVGIEPSGVTVGGIADVSGIAGPEHLLNGHHHAAFAAALAEVAGEMAPGHDLVLAYIGGPALTDQGRRGVPGDITSQGDTTVFDLWAIGDVTLDLLYGDRDPMDAAERWISRDLARGELVDAADAGRNVIISAHAQCMTAINTGKGLQGLREVVRRLRERYGARLTWMRPTELRRRVE